MHSCRKHMPAQNILRQSKPSQAPSGNILPKTNHSSFQKVNIQCMIKKKTKKILESTSALGHSLTGWEVVSKWKDGVRQVGKETSGCVLWLNNQPTNQPTAGSQANELNGLVMGMGCCVGLPVLYNVWRMKSLSTHKNFTHHSWSDYVNTNNNFSKARKSSLLSEIYHFALPDADPEQTWEKKYYAFMVFAAIVYRWVYHAIANAINMN